MKQNCIYNGGEHVFETDYTGITRCQLCGKVKLIGVRKYFIF